MSRWGVSYWTLFRRCGLRHTFWAMRDYPLPNDGRVYAYSTLALLSEDDSKTRRP